MFLSLTLQAKFLEIKDIENNILGGPGLLDILWRHNILSWSYRLNRSFPDEHE